MSDIFWAALSGAIIGGLIFYLTRNVAYAGVALLVVSGLNLIKTSTSRRD